MAVITRSEVVTRLLESAQTLSDKAKRSVATAPETDDLIDAVDFLIDAIGMLAEDAYKESA